ncbi:Predicted thioesterase [Flexibacter flexilis DSM 6793]|uniref:Predicted thioesterase n=1 Tax=Flexibacter flexilis DSM 6793 TaxID=927664 RepID=A0A1I1HV07_9BACT|nr:hypothetical protein [Flexibacter flexilis]SFC27721.1 Predicted thioesterase [Flexibacter flexilis DSM 6793]
MEIVGKTQSYTFVVTDADTASFGGKQVHPVCSTFVLAREAEWAGRLLLLEIKADDEEGIGSALSVQHHSPALVGQTVNVLAKIVSWDGKILVCDYTMHVGQRLVAKGQTEQRLLPKSRILQLFDSVRTI